MSHVTSLSLCSLSCSALLWQIKARFPSFKLQIACTATGSRVPGFAIFVCRMWHCCSARLWSALSFYVGLSRRISDGEQSVFISLKCAALQPSPGWGDLYVPPPHISSIMPWVFISYHDPERCTAIEFGHFFIPLCLSAFDMLSAWKFTAPCHSSSSNLLMCHSVSHVMNKHADVQRDECWLEMR